MYVKHDVSTSQLKLSYVTVVMHTNNNIHGIQIPIIQLFFIHKKATQKKLHQKVKKKVSHFLCIDRTKKLHCLVDLGLTNNELSMFPDMHACTRLRHM